MSGTSAQRPGEALPVPARSSSWAEAGGAPRRGEGERESGKRDPGPARPGSLHRCGAGSRPDLDPAVDEPQPTVAGGLGDRALLVQSSVVPGSSRSSSRAPRRRSLGQGQDQLGHLHAAVARSRLARSSGADARRRRRRGRRPPGRWAEQYVHLLVRYVLLGPPPRRAPASSSPSTRRPHRSTSPRRLRATAGWSWPSCSSPSPRERTEAAASSSGSTPRRRCC